jgi:hypothetical protein
MAPATLAAQTAPAPPTRSQFDALWTPWAVTNRQAQRNENDAVQQVRRDLATADAVRQAQLRDQGRALGERVGEIVRGGDCDDGERTARRAGDFALVEAVRDYCRQHRPQAAPHASP